MRKFIMLFVCLLSVSLSVDYAFATPRDVQFHWAGTAINTLIENKIMLGYEDGRFKPSKYVTREEACVLLTSFAQEQGLIQDSDLYIDSTLILTDVKNTWSLEAIQYMYRNNIMQTYPDATFQPKTLLTRESMAYLFYNFYEHFGLLSKEEISSSCPFTDIENSSPFVADLTKKTRTTIYPSILATYGMSYGNVADFSSSPVEDLRAELLDGNPVVVYATMHWEKPFYRYYNIEGERQRLLSNNHVVLACGYDMNTNMYYISDPYNANDTSKENKYWISGDTFERIYNERKHALVIQ